MSVGIQWSHEGKVGGIIRVTFNGLSSIPGGRIEVRAAGKPIFATEAGSDDQCPVNIHTHLLDNDRVRLEASALAAHAQPAAKRDVELDIENIGPVAEAVRDSLRGRNTPIAFAGPCDASRYDYGDARLKPWFDRDDAFDFIQRLVEEGSIQPHEVDLLKHFVEFGYVILPERLPDSLVDEANQAIEQAVASRYQGYEWGSSQRLEQMHRHWPALRAIWRSKYIHGFLSRLFRVQSVPCQSLVYVFGSQQDAHQDTIHLTSFPAGYMCGVWVALEDVQENSGELIIYPGSHRMPRVYLKDEHCPKVRGDWGTFGRTVVKRWQQLVEQSGIAPVAYRPKRGTVLVWHENLMHAGSVRIDKTRSRKSIVTHNFASGAIAYYDSTGEIGHVYPE